jgi:KaiC/GvpD/RAD55 family RecA-like ATPase
LTVERFVGEGIWVPILSDIVGRKIQRGKFLVGFYEPAAHWLSFALTLTSTLLQKGYVVNITTTSTPPSEIRRILNGVVPDLNERQVASRFNISDIYTWQTGRKSDEADTADSLSLAKASIDFGTTWLKKSMPNYDFVVTDNFSPFMRYNDERAFTQWLDKIVPHVREMKGVRIWSFIKRVHSDALYAILESMADGIIELDYREKSGVLEHALRVKSMKGIHHSTIWRSLRVNSNGLMELST